MKLPLADAPTVRSGLADLIRTRRTHVAITVALQLFSAAAGVCLPWILGRAIDQIRAGTSLAWVEKTMAASIVLVVFSAVLAFFADYQARVLGEKIFAQLREDLLNSVTGLPLSEVEDAGTGDLLGRTSHDIESVQFLIRTGLSAILVLMTTVVATIVAGALTSVRLLPILLLMIPMAWLLMRWYIPRTVPSYRSTAALWAEASGMAAETIQQAETVDSSGLGRIRSQRLDSMVREIWRIERYGAWMRMFLIVGLIVIGLIPGMLMAVAGSWMISKGWVSIGAVVSMTLFTYQLRDPVRVASFWIDRMQTAQVAFTRIFGVSLVEPDRSASGKAPEDTVITASDVHYAYIEGLDVLHGLNLELIPGETLAIVGLSGSGKSTFGRMLAGIHPPTSGEVTVGGVPLVDLEEDHLRSQVVLVTQEHHIFVGTIADNLRLVKPGASDEQLREALVAVEAESWLGDLDEGLETLVGSGGMALSPAQAQQIGLARIVLMDPHTLILDEATSLIDPTAARSLER